MNHPDDITSAVALLKQTLPEMNKRNISTTPDNYAVWYEYVSGENRLLNEAINQLDNTHTNYSVEVLKSLYTEYIANAHESAVSLLSESVKEIIHDFLTKIGKEGEGLSDYAKTLSVFSSRVDAVNDVEDIKQLIGHLLQETKKREDATQSMQVSLETMALEMKKLRAEVSKLNAEATTDPLTRVNNRRSFDMEIENVIASCRSSSNPLCLLMFDIDHFKKFNDEFGVAIGDKVLKFVATLIKNNIKGSDSVSRFSGAQFAILLPETSYEGAMVVADIIRDRLSKQTLSDSAEKKELGTITASIGVAPCLIDESAEQVIRKANKLMLDAKKEGRNKVLGDPNLQINENENSNLLI